jgi:hypothetical protein
MKMETQQMMELLLARMNSSMKEHMQEMMARMNANQAEMKADIKSDQEQMLAEISARMDANTKEMKVNTKAIQERIEADRKSNREDLKGMMEEMINANQAEMRSTVCAIRSELETIQHEIRAIIQPICSELDETISCNKATETEPDPGMMPSVAGHQENPKGEAAVMTVEDARKRRRVQNPAAEHRQKRKERIQGNHGSRRKLAATCRKVSCHAKVAWQKRKLFRKIETLEKCGWRMESATARTRTTHCAKVAWRREHDHKRYDKDNVAPRTPRGWTFRMKRQPEPECSNGIRI